MTGNGTQSGTRCSIKDRASASGESFTKSLTRLMSWSRYIPQAVCPILPKFEELKDTEHFQFLKFISKCQRNFREFEAHAAIIDFGRLGCVSRIGVSGSISVIFMSLVFSSVIADSNE